MQVTSNQANKVLKTYQEELSRLYKVDHLSSTFIAAINEKSEDARPEFDFQKHMETYMSIQAKIRAIKHAINVFNTTTYLDGLDITIDEALIYLPQLSSLASNLSSKKNRLQKIRCQEMHTNNNIEYDYANYDIEDATKLYNEVNEKIIKIQTALDILNNTKTFEMPS